jgi:UDP-3-O-[3-hydroxymyristoyl] glucosamine N-acyltransferase
MKRTLKEIAQKLSGELFGDPNKVIKNIANIEDSQVGDITFVTDERSCEKAEASLATALITPNNIKRKINKPYITVPNIKLAMARALSFFDKRKKIVPGISKTAVIAKTAKIDKSATIMSGAVIGENCIVGGNSIIYPNVVLYDDTVIGKNVIVHAGSVIGVDGFGFAPLDGKHEKIPQIGNVVIEDDVEIFANVCISRATMGSTIIKSGTKIDNLSHIAHNCKIGNNCAITALVAIAGSSELKDHVSIGGTSGLSDHVTVGENTIIMGRSGVTKDIPANTVVSGFPAQEHKKELEQQVAVRKLPKIIERISEIEKKLKN